MSIANEKLKPSVSRFQLLKLGTAVHVTADLVNIGSNVFHYAFGSSINFDAVEYNGDSSIFTLKASLAAVTSVNDYYLDEAAGGFYVKLAGTPSGTDHYVIFHDLLFTNGQYRSWHLDPDNSATSLRQWSPRLKSNIPVKQTQRNIVEGLITYDNTSARLDNSDNYFQQFLAEDATVSNRDFEVWETINGFENIRKIFTGKVNSCSISEHIMQIGAYESIYSLRDPAYLGFSAGYMYGPAIGLLPSTEFGGHLTRPKRTLFAARGPETFVDFSDIAGATFSTRFMIDGSQSAGCRAYNSIISDATNRNWYLGLCLGDIKTQSFGAVQAVANSGSHVMIRFASITNVNVGDTIRWLEGGFLYYARISHVGNFTFAAVTYNVAAWDYTALVISLGSTVYSQKCVAVCMTGSNGINNTSLPLLYGRDYTVSENPSTAGPTRLTLDFTANFETTYYAAAFIIDPNMHDLKWTVSSDGDYSHGGVIQFLLESAGLTVDAASITAANLALTDETQFSVPGVDEDSFSQISKYLSDILKSTLGYLYVKPDGSIGYSLFSAPSPSASSVIQDRIKHRKSLQIDVEYQDIVQSIIFKNPHLPGGAGAALNPTLTDLKSTYLNKSSASSLIFQHVLKLNGSSELSRQDEILAVLSRRRATYSYATSTEDIDRTIGDDVKIETDEALGDSGEADVKIIGIENTGRSTKVRALDLAGL